MLKGIIAILSAVFVFFSSMSIEVSIHTCNGEIKDLAVYGKSEPCDMYYNSLQNDKNQCPHHMKGQNNKKGCCKDQEIVVEGEDHKNYFDKSDVKPVIPIPAIYVFEFSNLWSVPAYIHNDFVIEPPPQIIKHRTTDFQQFLI